MELLIKNGDTVFVSGNPFSALSLSATDETFNTRRAGGGFSATINDDGAVITVIAIGGGDYVTQLIP